MSDFASLNGYKVKDKDLRNSVASEFNPIIQYHVGDIVFHENQLYKCTTENMAGEPWDSAVWSATNLAEMIKTVLSVAQWELLVYELGEVDITWKLFLNGIHPSIAPYTDGNYDLLLKMSYNGQLWYYRLEHFGQNFASFINTAEVGLSRMPPFRIGRIFISPADSTCGALVINPDSQEYYYDDLTSTTVPAGTEMQIFAKPLQLVTRTN